MHEKYFNFCNIFKKSCKTAILIKKENVYYDLNLTAEIESEIESKITVRLKKMLNIFCIVNVDNKIIHHPHRNI